LYVHESIEEVVMLYYIYILYIYNVAMNAFFSYKYKYINCFILYIYLDLAGSERASKTGATGATLKEGTNINLSLMTLGTK
jgi:hypothetical protein